VRAIHHPLNRQQFHRAEMSVTCSGQLFYQFRIGKVPRNNEITNREFISQTAGEPGTDEHLRPDQLQEWFDGLSTAEPTNHGVKNRNFFASDLAEDQAHTVFPTQPLRLKFAN